MRIVQQGPTEFVLFDVSLGGLSASPKFETIHELVSFADKHGIELEMTDELFGYRLGEMVVQLSEGKRPQFFGNPDDILIALDAETDSAYKGAALSLGLLLIHWAANGDNRVVHPLLIDAIATLIDADKNRT